MIISHFSFLMLWYFEKHYVIFVLKGSLLYWLYYYFPQMTSQVIAF